MVTYLIYSTGVQCLSLEYREDTIIALCGRETPRQTGGDEYTVFAIVDNRYSYYAPGHNRCGRCLERGQDYSLENYDWFQTATTTIARSVGPYLSYELILTAERNRVVADDCTSI